MNIFKKNSLLRSLAELKGNPRACVYTEPMWGLSMNLCLPYASVYMLGLGMNDVEVGIISSVYMFSQMIFSILSGAIVDKLGRRKSTALFDFLSWSIPCLIWASSQGFWFFVVAALFNGMMKITTISWDCLMVEDAPKDKITAIYSGVTIAGNMSALFAPISSILVSKLTMVPAIRILYINAFVVMTLKILLLYKFSTETEIGRMRMESTQNRSWPELLKGYKIAFEKIVASKGTIFAIVVSILVEIVAMLGTTFWQIIVSKRIGVSDTLLPIFPMLRSIMSMLMFFTIMGRLHQSKLKWPLISGFAASIAAYLLLISITGTGTIGYVILCVSLLFEAFGQGVLYTLRESLVAIYVDPEERSNILSILQTTVMLVSVPFGYIGGVLSDISRMLPFVLCMVLLAIGVAATFIFYGSPAGQEEVN